LHHSAQKTTFFSHLRLSTDKHHYLRIDQKLSETKAMVRKNMWEIKTASRKVARYNGSWRKGNQAKAYRNAAQKKKRAN
jgi:hypothetical protein